MSFGQGSVSFSDPINGADSGVQVVAGKLRLGLNPLLATTNIPLSTFVLSFLDKNAGNLISFNPDNSHLELGNATLRASIYFRSNDVSAGAGSKWGIVTDTTTGFTEPDPLLFIGWNYKGLGLAIDQTKYATGLGMEALYQPGDVLTRRSEQYSFSER